MWWADVATSAVFWLIYLYFYKSNTLTNHFYRIVANMTRNETSNKRIFEKIVDFDVYTHLIFGTAESFVLLVFDDLAFSMRFRFNSYLSVNFEIIRLKCPLICRAITRCNGMQRWVLPDDRFAKKTWKRKSWLTYLFCFFRVQKICPCVCGF